MSFICPTHNWSSDDFPCPACQKTVTTADIDIPGEAQDAGEHHKGKDMADYLDSQIPGVKGSEINEPDDEEHLIALLKKAESTLQVIANGLRGQNKPEISRLIDTQLMPGKQ